MKVRVELIGTDKEEAATLEVYQVTEELEKVINRLKINNEAIQGRYEGAYHWILLNDIYYIEGIENKIFAYTKDRVYEIKEKLYQFEEKYCDFGFVRISKSVVVNIEKIDSVAAALHARFEIKLINGEKVIVSRSFVKELKRRLQM